MAPEAQARPQQTSTDLRRLANSAQAVAMPPGPPSLLELPGSALEAVISHLGPHAARLRRASRGCRDLVDASAQEIGLLVRADDGQDLRALLALLRKSTVLRAVQLRFSLARTEGQAQCLAVAPVLSALWTVPRLEVRARPSGRGRAAHHGPTRAPRPV